MAQKESFRHKFLKKFARIFLLSQGYPEESIYEEFAIGPVKFDIVAYPSIGEEHRKIGIECGKKKGSVEECYDHFKKALKFVDFVIWIPYSIYYAPYSDLMGNLVNHDLFFKPLPLPFQRNELSNLKNTSAPNIMASLIIFPKGRFPELENNMIGELYWTEKKTKENPKMFSHKF